MNLFEIMRNIADFTNWDDQAQKTLDTVKQQQVGSSSGLLENAVQELEDLN